MRQKLTIAILTTMLSGLVAAGFGAFEEYKEMKKDVAGNKTRSVNNKEDLSYMRTRIDKKLDRIEDHLIKLYKGKK